MGVHADIDIRMKHNYEEPYKFRLTRRTPVIIRIDGRAFHTFAKGFVRPFDDVLRNSMKATMLYLCENTMGCVYGYTQSDEITLVLVDYDTLEASAFFDYDVQKLCSITASMATMRFNKSFENNVEKFRMSATDRNAGEQWIVYHDALAKGAMFDSRCYNIPKEEVCNQVYARQIDAIRNSVQLVAQTYYGQSELDNKPISELKEMLKKDHDIDWNNYPIEYQRGSSCIKTDEGWVIDTEMPILKGEAREYIERYIFFD